MKNKVKFRQLGSVTLFVLPALIPLIVFWIYPILRSVYISFTDWDYMTPDYNFVFFDNFISLFQDARFYDALWNTVVFTLGTLIPTIVLGLMLALLMQKAFKGSGIIKFILFSPWITPTVAVSIVWTWIYDPNTGIANTVMRFLHLPELQWIKSSDTAMLAVIIVTVWKSLGYAMIFYLSALEKVPKELYEASGLDGAKRWQRFRDVTIPCISPTTFFLVIITMVTSLQAYDQIQILTQGGPSGSTRTLLYMYYQLGFEEFNMGQATAVAIVMIIITVVLSAVQFGASKKCKNSSRYGRSRCLCYHDFFVCNGADLPVYFSAAAFRISADDCVYPCYCGTGAVCRNVSEKSNAAAVSGAGSLPASDYNQLCGTRSCTDKCAEIL